MLGSGSPCWKPWISDGLRVSLMSQKSLVPTSTLPIMTGVEPTVSRTGRATLSCTILVRAELRIIFGSAESEAAPWIFTFLFVPKTGFVIVMSPLPAVTQSLPFTGLPATVRSFGQAAAKAAEPPPRQISRAIGNAAARVRRNGRNDIWVLLGV